MDIQCYVMQMGEPKVISDRLTDDEIASLAELERFAVKMEMTPSPGATPLQRALREVVDHRLAGRDHRQAQIFGWAVAAFGPVEASSLPQRGLRLLEEAIEAYQAAGGAEELAHELVSFVFKRPRGELAQEIGQVTLVALTLAAAAGVSAEAEEVREVARVLSKPVDHFAKRNEAKNAAGFLTGDASCPTLNGKGSCPGCRWCQ